MTAVVWTVSQIERGVHPLNHTKSLLSGSVIKSTTQIPDFVSNSDKILNEKDKA